MTSIKMTKKQLTVALIGFFVTVLGLIWFLQGAALLHLCPVLCITNCECVTGGSQVWEVAGAIGLIVGITIIGISVRHARPS
jgi:hypothetical protein